MSSDAINNEVANFIVIGKLGDHCKKLIELRMLQETEPHLARSLQLQIQALEDVITGWPLKNEEHRSKLSVFIHTLDIEMRNLTLCETTLRTEVKHGQDQVLILRYALHNYIKAMDQCRLLIKQLNLISESGIGVV